MAKKSKGLPTATCDGLTFYPIPEITDLDAAFGFREDRYFNRRALPKVPEKFEDAAQKLFFSGGDIPASCNGVDRAKAIRFMRALLSSFAPPHESKIATAAYAFWVWSTPEIVNEKSAA